MILSQFARAVSAPYPDLEHILKSSRAQDRGGKMAQKGDFSGAGSFENCLSCVLSAFPLPSLPYVSGEINK